MNALSRLAVGLLLTGAALLSVTPAQAAPNTGSGGGGGFTPQPPVPSVPSAPDGSGNPFGSSNGSASGSCSGSMPQRGYFYAYTYQSAWVRNGKVDRENHNFTFNGFLSGAEHAPVVGPAGDKWIVYRADDFDLAVPYVDHAGLYLLDTKVPGSYWIKLCDY